jgi:hypothetical protein
LRLILLSAWARRGSAIAGGRHRLYLLLLTIAAVGGVANTGVPVRQGFHLPRVATGTAAPFGRESALLIDFNINAGSSRG